METFNSRNDSSSADNKCSLHALSRQGVLALKSADGGAVPSGCSVVTLASATTSRMYRLTRRELSRLPVIEHKTEHVANRFALTCCVICAETFSEGERLRALRCGHCFHVRCVDKWLLGTVTLSHTRSSRCPLCNTDAVPLRTKAMPGEEVCESCGSVECRACGVPTWAYVKIGAKMFRS